MGYMDERVDQSELDALWNFDDPIASADRFAQAAAESDRAELVRAELETQRARALGLQQRFDEADALLDSLEPALGVLAVRIPLERGRLRTSSGRKEEAVPLFEEALARARREGDVFLAVDAAHMLAIADEGRSAHWTAEALAELQSATDSRTRRWAVTLHNNRGLALIDAGHPAAALEEFATAFSVAREVGTDTQLFWAEWAVAHCLRLLGRSEEALAIQQRLSADRPEDPDVVAELAALTDVAPTIEP
jgi:tetratricopeptide (TPR) repeat protein